MQTACGLPKKSLEERKVSSKGGRSKASGGKKVVQKKAKGGGGEVGQRAEGGEKRRSTAFSSAFFFNREPDARFTRITFFDHVFFKSGRGRRQKTFRSSRHKQTGVMQTASGLPKKSLEERKVSSEGGGGEVGQ